MVLISGISAGANARTVGLYIVDRKGMYQSNTTPLVGVGLIRKLTTLPIEVGVAVTIYLGRLPIKESLGIALL